MKIIITENQLKKYKSLLEQSVYDEDDYDYYSNNNQDDDEYNDKEGMRITGELSTLPIRFEYSEEKINEDGEIEYYGEIQFNGDEFLGVIATDKRGYLIDFDFYSVLSDDDIRLQNVLRDMNPSIYYEFEHWLDSEVIPQIKD